MSFLVVKHKTFSFSMSLCISLIFYNTSCKAENSRKIQNYTYQPTYKLIIKDSTFKENKFFHSYMATLKDGLKKVNATINDSIIFSVSKGELFFYEQNSEEAWLPDGRIAYIPLEKVKHVDTPLFKFNFQKWDFHKEKDYELLELANSKNIALNSLINKIRNKNSHALMQFFNLRNYVDGAAAEEYSTDFWALINLWNDTELMNFINTLKINKKKEFCKLLLNSTPFENPEEYYKLYYPSTLKLINGLNKK